MIELILATILFSISFGLIKANLATIDPNFVVFSRLLLASIIFLPAFLIKYKTTKEEFLKAFLIGAIQFGLMSFFYLRAYTYLKGSEIALLTASTPMFVYIISSFYSKKNEIKEIFFVLLAIIGGLFVVFRENSLNFALLGVILMELSNITFALGQILWKKHLNKEASSLMFPAYFGGSFIGLLACSIFGDFSAQQIALNQWLSISYLGIVPTGIGFWLWSKGCKKVSEITLSAMNNLKIPIGALFAIIFFKESIGLANFSIGLTLVLIAIFGSIKLTKEKKG